MLPRLLERISTKHLMVFSSRSVASVKSLLEMRQQDMVRNTKMRLAFFMKSAVEKWLGGSPDGVSESGKLVEIKCPPQRAIIPGEVPEHYMPQLQLCMEILDLEEADFIQYKPAETNWPRPEEFDVVTVKRDREWWKTYLPVMRDFWDKVLYYREHLDELPPPKLKKTRKKKEPEPVICQIEPLPEEDPYDDY